MRIRRTAFLRVCFHPLVTFFHDGEVGEGELELHDLEVARGVDADFGVGDGRLFESAHDVDEHIDVAQAAHVELVRATFDEARKENELDGRRRRLPRLMEPR